MNEMEGLMRTLLVEAFGPVRLGIVDESQQHAGHRGARPGGGTHYVIDIAAAAFAGKSRVEAHKMVFAVLKPAFDQGLHSVNIKTGVE